MALVVAPRWRRILLATFALLTLASVAGTFLCVARSYSNVPWRDEWVHLAEYQRVLRGEPLWPILWNPHYGHRLPITRLTLFACIRWFHFYRWPLLLLIFTYQALLLALLARLAHRLTLADPHLFLAAIIPTTHLLFSPLQMENFVWGVQVHFVASYALPILAFCFLARSRLLPALTCATIASLYFATGLAAWPALLLEAFLLRLPRRTISILAATAAVVWATYLYHYQHPNMGLGPLGLLLHPWDTFRLAATIAGAPLTNHNLLAGMAAGTLLLALSLYSFTQSGRTPTHTVLRSAIAFLWFSILMMVAGRLTIPAVTSRQNLLILPSRYLTPAFILAALLWILALADRNRRIPLFLTALTVFAYTYAQIPYELQSNRAWIALFQRMDAAALGFLFDIYDPLEQDPIWPVAAGLPSHVAFLREHRLGPFAESRSPSLPATLLQFTTQPVTNGFRVTAPLPPSAPRDLLLQNKAGEVIGALRRTPAGYLGYSLQLPPNPLTIPDASPTSP